MYEYETELTESSKLRLRIFDIELWFNSYDLQVAQFQRSQRLGLEFDKDIKELDNEAVEKSYELKELRKELSEVLRQELNEALQETLRKESGTYERHNE